MVFWKKPSSGRSNPYMYLVSLESSLKMQENGDCFMLKYWKRLESSNVTENKFFYYWKGGKITENNPPDYWFRSCRVGMSEDEYATGIWNFPYWFCTSSLEVTSMLCPALSCFCYPSIILSQLDHDCHKWRKKTRLIPSFKSPWYDAERKGIRQDACSPLNDRPQ